MEGHLALPVHSTSAIWQETSVDRDMDAGNAHFPSPFCGYVLLLIRAYKHFPHPQYGEGDGWMSQCLCYIEDLCLKPQNPHKS